MIIKLVSFPYWNPDKKKLTSKQRKLRIDIASKILNEKDTDFVMFSEWIFYSPKDLDDLCQLVHNKKVTALFELALPGGLEGNHLYLLQNGKILDLETYQIFCQAKDANRKNIEMLIDELEQHRQFVVKGKHFLVIQCGENLILKTTQSDRKNTEFRLQDSKLKKRFDKVISSADVILNPVHYRWSRFHEFEYRQKKFSERQRCCFSCTQLEGNMLKNALKNPTENTSQRAMRNGKLLAPFANTDVNNKDYLMLSYEI